MASGDPIRLFVCHAWQEHDDYLRVFEYLECARGFVYTNCSQPTQQPKAGSTPEAARDELRLQIGRAEAVIALTGLVDEHREWLQFEMTCAKATHKPVVLLPRFGQPGELPASFKGLWDELVGWDDRAIVDAVRRQARHEETARWDTIEFKMD
jgi:hypothetical protein